MTHEKKLIRKIEYGDKEALGELIEFKFLNIGKLSVWTPYVLVFFAVIQIPLFLEMTVYSHCKMRQ